MRDAFGGTFMIQVFMVFILIYICFTAVALNYAKAFKVKNLVVDYLESNEITSLDDLSANELKAMYNEFETEILGNMNYNAEELNICEGYPKKTDSGKIIAICHDAGIIIRQKEIAEDEKNTEGVYYTVSTYVRWSLPFLNNLLALGGNKNDEEVISGAWRISGQTKLIVNE